MRPQLFAPILATVPTVLVVIPTLPVRALDEFVKLDRSQPGKLSYGSAGYGSVHHLTMALFAERGGELWCELAGERVVLKGNAVLTMKGSLTI